MYPAPALVHLHPLPHSHIYSSMLISVKRRLWHLLLFFIQIQDNCNNLSNLNGVTRYLEMFLKYLKMSPNNPVKETYNPLYLFNEFYMFNCALKSNYVLFLILGYKVNKMLFIRKAQVARMQNSSG